MTNFSFFLLELEELISIISNMIYIEVLELRFCGLDYELKKNITIRGLEDKDATNRNERQYSEMDIKSNSSGGSNGSDNEENGV